MINIQLLIQCDRCRNEQIEYEAVSATVADDPSELLADDGWLVTDDGRHIGPGCRPTVEDEQAREAADDYRIDAARQAEIDNLNH